MNNSKKTIAGFTLAEVLITLAIVGVVAALTIPTLMKEYQKTQYITALKKSYSQASQALISLTTDKNCLNDLVCTGLFSTTDISVFGDEYVKYFKIAKNCKLAASQGCFATDVYPNYDRTGSKVDWDATTNNYKFITADGIAYAIAGFASPDCANSYTRNITNDLTQSCGSITMDTNGPFKQPNTRGLDIFTFYISNGKGAKLYPRGGQDQASHYWSNPDGTPRKCYPGDTYAEHCSGRIMEQNWQINYY